MARLEELQKMLDQNPSDNFITYAIALEHAKLEDVDEAILLLKQLLQRDPEYLAAYYQLGKLYEMKQDEVNASITYVKGIDVAKHKKDQRTLNELKSAFEMLEE